MRFANLSYSDWMLCKQYHQSAMFEHMGRALKPWVRRRRPWRSLAEKLAGEFTPDELWRVRLCDQEHVNRERRLAYEARLARP